MARLRYLLRCILRMDYRAMLKTVGGIHQKSGKNRLVLFFDMLYCGFKYGAGYKDYDLNEWWTLNKAQRATYITRGINNTIVARCNNAEDYHLLDNKIDFNRHFSDALGRSWIDLTTATEEKFIHFLSGVKAVFAKPIDATCGRGCEKYETADISDPARLYHELKATGSTLVEEYIVQHPDLSRLYPHAVNTLRIVTLTDKDGEPHVLYAFLRIGQGGRVVDNLNSGGMAAPIDLQRGVIEHVAFDKDYHYFDTHPDTGIPLIGYPIPYWKEATDLVITAARRIPRLRYVGWDVAVTESGVTLVEGNQHPGHDILQMPPHTPDKIGMLPRYRQYIDIAITITAKKQGT